MVICGDVVNASWWLVWEVRSRL